MIAQSVQGGRAENRRACAELLFSAYEGQGTVIGGHDVSKVAVPSVLRGG